LGKIAERGEWQRNFELRKFLGAADNPASLSLQLNRHTYSRLSEEFIRKIRLVDTKRVENVQIRGGLARE
jgi:hypothetical protein